jgi:hypothetical protein
MSNYRKTMADALLEMYPLTEETQLDEGTIDKVKEIASKKQAMKIDGVMVDSFTASAISQIYDKVNDNIKKKMDSLPITKLANLAFKMMQKNEFVPEEVELDEAPRYRYKIYTGKTYLGKEYGKDEDEAKKNAFERGGSATNWKTKLSSNDLKAIKEEVDLDEGTKQVLAHGGKGKYKVTKDGDKIEIKFGGKVVGTADFDRGADSFFVSIKGEKGQKSFDDAQAIADYFAKNKITEELDLEEGKQKPYVSSDSDGKHVMGASGKIVKSFKDMDSANAYLKKNYNELMKEADLDEGKMSQLHQYIKDKKSAEEIAKLMKVDVKTVKSLMSSHHPEDVEEASAYADARRSMSKDKDFSRKDSADDDTGATDDDVKGASKNIIMQLRKAGNRASRGVEFADGKKVQIPAKMALAVQQKYNSLKRPADKEKFQAQIAKSYKDMLNTLKAGYGEQKESILDRMNRKIKENKNG